MLKRTNLGFYHAFAVQYDGLRISASFYDIGHRNESVRMANAMFVLLGPQTKNHTSIVEHLRQTYEPWVYSTASKGNHGSALIAVECVPYTATEANQSGWIIGAVPFGMESIRGARRLSPDEWWSEGVLRGAGESEHLTRLQIVRIMRDQDGGAHLDDHVKDQNYLRVHLQGVGFRYTPSNEAQESLPVEGVIEATIRQMATEVLESFRSLRITAQVTLANAAKNGPLNLQFFEKAPI
ncbi:MAG: hypothetical protein WAM17_14420 [Rhodoplanes sp.]